MLAALHAGTLKPSSPGPGRSGRTRGPVPFVQPGLVAMVLARYHTVGMLGGDKVNKESIPVESAAMAPTHSIQPGPVHRNQLPWQCRTRKGQCSSRLSPAVLHTIGVYRNITCLVKTLVEHNMLQATTCTALSPTELKSQMRQHQLLQNWGHAEATAP